MDARDIIYTELSTVDGEKNITGDAFMIQCPFHGDTNPSLGVNLTTDTNIPLGFFHCFGCGEKGNWNGLANKLGLQNIKEWQLGFTGNGTQRSERKRRSVLHYTCPEDQFREGIYTREVIKWPASRKWRGYKGTLIQKMGGLCYNDSLTKENMLFFPIYVNGQYRGGVRAYQQKQVDGNSYLTTKGSWAKKYGLLGFEYVKKLVRKYKYTAIVVVEGPRDEMRLLANGIPALAVLGIEVISEKKILMILSMSPRLKTIYVMPDNDLAGTQLFNNVKVLSKGLAEVKHLKLPKPKDDRGNLIKIDPDNCDKRIIKEVKKLMDTHRRSAS